MLECEGECHFWPSPSQHSHSVLKKTPTPDHNITTSTTTLYTSSSPYLYQAPTQPLGFGNDTQFIAIICFDEANTPTQDQFVIEKWRWCRSSPVWLSHGAVLRSQLHKVSRFFDHNNEASYLSRDFIINSTIPLSSPFHNYPHPQVVIVLVVAPFHLHLRRLLREINLKRRHSNVSCKWNYGVNQSWKVSIQSYVASNWHVETLIAWCGGYQQTT